MKIEEETENPLPVWLQEQKRNMDIAMDITANQSHSEYMNEWILPFVFGSRFINQSVRKRWC